MRRQEFAAVALATALLVAAPPAMAQRPEGTPVGTAEPRGGGGGGTAVPRGGSDGGGSASSTSSVSTSSSAPVASPSPNSDFRMRGSAVMGNPSVEPIAFAPQRRGGGGGGGGSNGGGGGGQAVPRSGGGSAAPAPRGGSSAPAGSSRAAGPSADSSSGQGSAVPAYSRPRDGQPAHGEAVQRTPPAGGGGGSIHPPYWYYGYPSYPYYWGSYGYGLSYLYDPWYLGLGYMYGYPYSYGYDPYGYGYGYGGGYGGGYVSGGGGSSSSRDPRAAGGLRLKIKPREAQVYVDGYLVGDVDSFDGSFQKLDIQTGPHKIELKADGYEPLQFDVLITAGETSTYKGEMKRIQ